MSDTTYRLVIGDEGGSEHTVEYADRPTVEEIEREAIDWCKGGDWGHKGAVVTGWWTLYAITPMPTEEDIRALVGADRDIDMTFDPGEILVYQDGAPFTAEEIKAVQREFPGSHVDLDGDLIIAYGEIEIDDGSWSCEIEADHEALIRAAVPRYAESCGDSPDDHDWESTVEIEGGCRENPGVWSLGGTAMRFAAHCTACGLRRVEHVTGSQRNPGEHDTTEYSWDESHLAEAE